MVNSYRFQTNICDLNIYFDENFIYAISFKREKDKRIEKYINKNIGEILEVSEENFGYKEEIIKYLNGDLNKISIPVKFFGTSFQNKVWKELLNIPYGETITYKEMAERIGHPKAYRAVGGALNKNPISIIVPCHRVIGSNGKLTGFGGGIDLKEKLLELESKDK